MRKVGKYLRPPSNSVAGGSQAQLSPEAVQRIGKVKPRKLNMGLVRSLTSAKDWQKG